MRSWAPRPRGSVRGGAHLQGETVDGSEVWKREVAVGRDRETSKQDDRARERRGRHACHRKCGFAVRRSRAKRRC